MYRVHLTEEEQQELKRLTRTPGLAPRTRERLEMVRLSHAGFSIPRIATHLGAHPQTVRHWIKRFQEYRFAGLPDQPHLGQQSQLTPALLAALAARIDAADRTWTASQLAAWLAEHHDLRLSAAHLGRLLRRHGLRYKRTQRHLKHKQKPEVVAAVRADLETLEKGAMPVAWTSGISTKPGSR